MQFNDTSTELGICQEIDDLCDTNVSSYSLAKKARRANTALLELELLALMASGTWQFDDKNYTSLPTGLKTMVSGTQEYQFDSSLLNIEKVEILLANGTYWQTLNPIDENLKDNAYLTITGTPLEYYKRGEFIGLTPIPTTGNVTMTNGLRITFSRTGSLFVASDTTKEPGIAAPFHILIAQMSALPYCKTFKKDRVAELVLSIREGKKLLEKYYASRAKDEGGGQMTMARVSGR